ncbi:short chain dehydrogenase [Teratosphaeria destructans]|uniref:Short chain dehydrogenase n=1 Tax=Teratosphaeria destructans TaxID=418781 RepID=A0A9W7SV72_9PEZI|nr:short chain dehydrogenase [Teratosphaeria destructans]
MTNQCYPSRRGGVGIPARGVDVMRGSDGEIGSGAYLLDWDGKSIGDETLLRRYREQGLRRKVWEHTMAMFAQAERLNPRGRKRPASAEAEGSARPVPNPIGWRPG